MAAVQVEAIHFSDSRLDGATIGTMVDGFGSCALMKYTSYNSSDNFDCFLQGMSCILAINEKNRI